MKRFIILMIILLLTVLFIPLKTYAYSKSQLDVTITDLNNHTLREVFEGGNLVPNGNLSTLADFNLWTKNAQVTFDSINNRTVIDTKNAVSIDSPIFPDVNAGSVIYTIIDGYSASQAPLAFRYRLNGVVDSEIFTNIPFKQNRGFSSVINTYTRSFDQMAIIRNTLNTTAYLYNIKYINLTSLGISSLTVSQMDYWYSVYVFNKEHEVIVSNEGLGSDLMNVLKGFINTLISLFDYIMYTKVTILGIEFSFLGLIGSGLIILILAFQIIWLVI